MSKDLRPAPTSSPAPTLEAAAAGLAKRYGWLAGVLDEMRQFNARMKARHGVPKSARRDDSLKI